MKTNVAQTSIEAYYSLDHSTVRGKVAGEILRLTEAGYRSWIGKLAANLGLEKSTVSGRFNELKKQPFQYNGQWYRLEFAGKVPVKSGVRTITVETWGMRKCAAPQPIEQQTLFQ